VDQGFGLASEAGCKTPFSFSKQALAEKFLDFTNAPDELVPEINYDDLPCPKGKKASKKCKEKNGESDEDEDSSSKSGDDNQPTQSSTPPEATTADARPTQTNAQSSVTPTDTQPTETSIQSSSTSSDPSPTATAYCEEIGRQDMEELLKEDPSRYQDPVEKRTVGTTLQSRRLQARAFKPKPGNLCKDISKVEFPSNNYPSSGEAVMVSWMYTTECCVTQN
jgi:hypothetical protein